MWRLMYHTISYVFRLGYGNSSLFRLSLELTEDPAFGNTKIQNYFDLGERGKSIKENYRLINHLIGDNDPKLLSSPNNWRLSMKKFRA